MGSAIQSYKGDKITPAVRPDLAIQFDIKLPASVNYAAGLVLGEITASPGTFATYNSANSDGTQNPKCILETACQTDASGNITNSDTAGQTSGEWGQTSLVTPAYFSGYFRTEDLTGLDANAVAAGKLGVLKRGTVSLGLVCLP